MLKWFQQKYIYPRAIFLRDYSSKECGFLEFLKKTIETVVLNFLVVYSTNKNFRCWYMVYADSIRLVYFWHTSLIPMDFQNWNTISIEIITIWWINLCQINGMLSTTFLKVLINCVYFSLLLTKNQICKKNLEIDRYQAIAEFFFFNLFKLKKVWGKISA